jgi:hypothetical protein
MPENPPAGENASFPDSPDKRPTRRRWTVPTGRKVWALAIFIVLLAALVLALPSLLCTGPGVRFVESQIDARIKGTVTIGRLSLGWFSPAAISDLTLRDPAGDVVLSGVNVRTQLSLLRLLRDHQRLGKIDIGVRLARLATQRTARLNLMQALAGRTPAHAKPVAAKPVKPAAPSRAASKLSKWPRFSVRLNCHIRRLSWTSPSAPAMQASHCQLILSLDTQGQPVHVQFQTLAGVQNKPPAKITADAILKLFYNHRLLSPSRISGQINVHVNHLDLRAIQPALASTGLGLKVAGTLNMRLAIAMMKSLHAGKVGAVISIRQLTLGGPWLAGDEPHLGNLTSSTDCSWGLGQFRIRNAAVRCALGNLSLQGSGAAQLLTGLWAVRPHGTVPPGQTAQLRCHAAVKLAAFLRDFAHVFKTPARATFHGGQSTLNSTLVLGAPAGSDPIVKPALGAMNSAAGPKGILPAVAGQLQFNILPLSWNMPGQRSPRIVSADGKVAFDTAGKPLALAVNLQVKRGRKPPISFHLAGNLNVFHQYRLRAFNRLTGSVHLALEKFHLNYMQSLLARFHAPVIPTGVLHGAIAIHMPTPGAGSIVGKLLIDQMALGGEMLHSDHPQFGQVTIPIDVLWHGHNLRIRNLAIESLPADFSLQGAARVSTLLAMLHDQARRGHSSLVFQLRCNLPLLAANLPHTLGLVHSGLHLQSGIALLHAKLQNAGKTSVGTIRMNLGALRGHDRQRKFQINPFLLRAALKRRGTTWRFENAALFQAAGPKANPIVAPQLSLQLKAGSAHLRSYRLRLTAAAAPVLEQFAPFVDLHGRSLGGQVAVTLSVRHVMSPAIAYQGTLSLHNASLVLQPGQPPVKEPLLLLNAAGALAAPNRRLESLTSHFSLQAAELDISAGDVRIRRNTAGVWEVPKLRLAIQHGNLSSLRRLAVSFIPIMGRYRLAGELAGSSLWAAYVPGHATLSKCHLVFDNLSVGSTIPTREGALFREPQLTIDAAGDVRTRGTFQARIKRFALVCRDAAVDVALPQPVLLTYGPAGKSTVSAPAMKINGNLGRIRPLLVLLGVIKPNRTLQGDVQFTGWARSSKKGIALALQAGVKSYRLSFPSNPAPLPPTNLAADIQGRLNLAGKTFECRRTCAISENPATIGAGKKADQLVLAKGSVISFSPRVPENIRAIVRYDLARLNILLRPMLPKDLVMSGRHRMAIRITGRLTNGKGLRRFRSLAIAPTTFAFDHIATDGLSLGPGLVKLSQRGGILKLGPDSIPANAGRVNLAGHIDLNRPVPTFVIHHPVPLAVNINLNGRMGNTLLNFLPLTWGGGNNTNSVIQVKGLLNVRVDKAQIPFQYKTLNQTGTLTGTVSITHLSSNSPLFALIGRSVAPLGVLTGQRLRLVDSGIRPTKFDLTRGKIHYRNMQLVLTSFGMNFSGWVALDRRLRMDVSVTGAGLTLPVPLAIGGTTTAPKLHLSSRPLRNIGRGLPNLLNKIFGH